MMTNVHCDAVSERAGLLIATLRAAAAAGPHLSQWTQANDGYRQQMAHG